MMRPAQCQALKRLIVFTFLVIPFTPFAFPQSLSPDLKTLRPGHPRIYITDSDTDRIHELVRTDATARMIYYELGTKARKIMEGPTVEYKIVGPRLLTQSRNCLDRVLILGLLYRLDKKQEYLDRAKQELFAAAAFPDWNPSHFLDTAEMTHAFAVGYDWLFNDLTPDERTTIRTALIEKGLKAYQAGWDNGAWWTEATHNWNQVCHGGIGIGALAVADEEPEMAARILDQAVNSLPKALAGYAPDGGWNEGPGYWHYATRYTVYFMAALETALGTDYGLSNAEGFDKAGDFRIHFSGPTKLSFNYADAHPQVGSTHEMFWLARRFNKPVYAWYQRENLGSPSALDLVWFRSEGTEQDLNSLAPDSFFRGVDVAFFRGDWLDKNTLFVGFKGGDNQANHSHLDLGSFVLDADRVRWAIDLGPDDYNLPGYFSQDKRWTYFRNNTFSHNTLIINNENQNPQAAAPITFFSENPYRSFAIADLSQAYAAHARSVRRGIMKIQNRHLLLQDEIKADQPVQVEWGMLTEAEIDLNGNEAVLRQNGKEMKITILQPAQARFSVETANPPKPEKQNDRVKKIKVSLPEKRNSLSLSLLFSPGQQELPRTADQDVLLSLDQWK